MDRHALSEGDYRNYDCPKCGRARVLSDGVCEKCPWDSDGDNFASITRPDEYDVNGPIWVRTDENLIL